MRSPQARLLVSCFRRLGLDLPLKPAERGSFGMNLGKYLTLRYSDLDGSTFCAFSHHICYLSHSSCAQSLAPSRWPTDRSHTEKVETKSG